LLYLPARVPGRGHFSIGGRDHPLAEESTVTEERIDEEEVAVAQQWRDAMKMQVHNIIVSTLEASESMLEEVDPDSDAEELRVELMAVALKAVAAMGGGTKENFMEMARDAAQDYFDGDIADDA
jgi:hypothetical protein